PSPTFCAAPASADPPRSASPARARVGRTLSVGCPSNDPATDARHFLRVHQVPYVAVHSRGSVPDRFGLIGLPETFYIDRRGRIEDVTRGELSSTALDRTLTRALQN